MLILGIALAAGAVDHGPLDTLLQAHVSPEGVDYAGLAADEAKLDAYVASLAEVDPATLDRDARMAFWVDAYNALTLQLVVDHLPLSSIRELDGGNPWDARTWTVGGRELTLNAIEHEVLRPLGDPRIHAAINCASKGCPPLASRAFTGAELDQQLDAASAAWAKGNGIEVGDEVTLSRIFDWFGEDFAPRWGPEHHDIPGVDGEEEAAINFLAAYLDPATRERLRAGGYAVGFAEYDWSLNAR